VQVPGQTIEGDTGEVLATDPEPVSIVTEETDNTRFESAEDARVDWAKTSGAPADAAVTRAASWPVQTLAGIDTVTEIVVVASGFRGPTDMAPVPVASNTVGQTLPDKIRSKESVTPPVFRS
jgi:hypothetical protein